MLTNTFGLVVEYTSDKEKFETYPHAKLNYSNERFTDAIQIIPHSILFDLGIKDYLIEVHHSDTYLKYFFKNSKGDMPFDFIGASFWLISRYEEYLPFKANKYNVFDYRSSLAWQNNFLDVPLVNIWTDHFLQILIAKYPALKIENKKFSFVTTIDIDNVFKYKHKGFVRSLAGIYSDVIKANVTNFKNRMSTLWFNKTDEFDCYQFLIDTNKKFDSKAIYFFLLGDYNVNDKNHSANNPQFQTLIKHLADYSVAGIHPSFASNFNLKQLKIEIVRLASIIHSDVKHSRQHFGMLTFPSTYNALLQAGIKHDYSLGYTNKNGFRASICHPIRWYNISKEQETALTLHPFCLNDVEMDKLIEDHKHENVMHYFEKYLAQIKNSGGEFIIVFHNDRLANTERGHIWQKLYSNILEKANSVNAQ